MAQLGLGERWRELLLWVSNRGGQSRATGTWAERSQMVKWSMLAPSHHRATKLHRIRQSLRLEKNKIRVQTSLDKCTSLMEMEQKMVEKREGIK